MDLLAVWALEILISWVTKYTHNHRRVRGERDDIGQRDQSAQAGWESLDRKAVVWCLISHGLRADGGRMRDRGKVCTYVCVCVWKKRGRGVGGGLREENEGSDR